MEFDKSKVYTALNADEVKIRSKGYFSDNLKNLSFAVEEEYSPAYGEIEEIKDSSYGCRFLKKGSYNYSLFYPIEEPKENRFRPYKDMGEMIEDFKKRFNTNVPPYEKPLIWIKIKDTATSLLITSFSEICKVVTFADSDKPRNNLETLFEEFVYLDGSPCGIMEE